MLDVWKEFYGERHIEAIERYVAKAMASDLKVECNLDCGCYWVALIHICSFFLGYFIILR